RRLRRRAGAADVGGRRHHPAPGDPGHRRPAARLTRLRTERRASRVFSAWARGVYRHRWLAALAGLGILAALMLPALSLHLGEPGSSAQATSGPAHNTLATLT